VGANRKNGTANRPSKFHLKFPVPPTGDRIRVAVVYPGPAPEGASSLAVHHLVRLFCAHGLGAAEPVFAPVGAGRPRGHVTNRPLADFDLLAFSLAFEEQWVSLPHLLERSGIPVRGTERGGNHPVVLAGGVACRLNPRPGLSFLDALVPGDAEPVVGPILEALEASRGLSRRELFTALGLIDGMLVRPFTAGPVAARWHDAGPPAAQLGEPTGSEFDRMFLVETGRGCPAGCRFCALGFSRRPPVSYPAEDIVRAAEPGIARGLPIGLVGAGLSRHPQLEVIMEQLARAGSDLSPASLDPQVILSEAGPSLLAGLGRSQQRSVTLAPEAGSARLRRVINKPADDDVLPEAVRRLAAAGVVHLKLYLMFGLPGERTEDLDAIVDLVGGAREALLSVHRSRGGTGKVSVSLNPFVPKPHTPFELEPMPELAELKRRRDRIASGLRRLGGISLAGISPRRALLQCWLTRACEDAAGLLETCRGRWPPPGGLLRAQAGHWQALVTQPWPDGREPPWRLVRPGIAGELLLSERARASQARTSGACRAQRCPTCAACSGLT